MPVTLQEAIERTKLSADDSNHISQELFDQFLQSLDERDRHAYVTSLVELGIMTKYSRREDIDHMKNVMAYKEKDIAEEFIKAAFFPETPSPDDEDVYEGLNIDWEEEEADPYEKTVMVDQTNGDWSQQQPQVDEGPLWPQAPGQVYTDEGQTQLEYDPDMDLSIDPEFGYEQTQVTQLPQTVEVQEPEGFWPSQPGMVYTDQGQLEEEYDPEMDLSLDPLAEETGPDTRNMRRQQSIVASLIKSAQSILDYEKPMFGTYENDEVYEDGSFLDEVDDSLYKEFLSDEPETANGPSQDDEWSETGYEILEERPIDQEPSEEVSEAPSTSQKSDEVSSAEEFLVEKNIKVSEDGTVTFHQGTSGIHGEGVANLSYLLDPNEVTSMPVEKAVKLFQQGVRASNNELARVGELQDSLLSFSKTLNNINEDIFATMDKLEGTFEILNKFKYNEKNPNESIASIARGLSEIKANIQEKMNSLQEFSEEFSSGTYKSYDEPIKNLQAIIDEYKSTQYDKAKESEEILQALEIVSQSVVQQGGVE